MNSIIDYKNIDFNNIVIKRPIQLINNLTLFDIQYRHSASKKTHCVLKTPKIIIPFRPSIYENNNGDTISIQLLLRNDYDTEISDFSKCMKHLEEYIYTKLSRKYPNILNLKRISIIKCSTFNNIDNELLRTKVSMIKNIPAIEIYNLDREKIDFTDIPINSPVYAYLNIEKIWMNSDSIGLHVQIIQIYKIACDINISDCNTDDVVDDNTSEYLTFFKMLSVGIPRDAIKQKMILAGFDPTVIDRPRKPTPFLSGLTLPPPPPPMPRPSLLLPHTTKTPSLTDLLSGKNKLKSVDASIVVKKCITHHKGPKPPSLDDIVDGLKNLKKSTHKISVSN